MKIGTEAMMFLQLSLILECSFGVTGRQNVDLTHELSDRSNRLWVSWVS